MLIINRVHVEGYQRMFIDGDKQIKSTVFYNALQASPLRYTQSGACIQVPPKQVWQVNHIASVNASPLSAI